MLSCLSVASPKLVFARLLREPDFFMNCSLLHVWDEPSLHSPNLKPFAEAGSSQSHQKAEINEGNANLYKIRLN